MHGRHLRKRGRWWHYYRNRPRRYEDIETRPVITFALRTTCFSEAKAKAAQISYDLESQWELALNRGTSLSSALSVERYKASIETNLAHGFTPMNTKTFSDQELLTRLRFLVSGDVNDLEKKSVLGFVEKPEVSLMNTFERFWLHIEDEWAGLSHDQRRVKRNVYLKTVRHFEEAVGSIPFYDINRIHAVKFRAWWIQRKKENGFKSCTANRELDCMRRLTRVIYDIDGNESTNPFVRLRLKADVEVRRSPLTNEQILSGILAPGKLDGIHFDFQLLVKLVINTGMRPIEAIGLELKDFKVEHEIPHVHVRENKVRVLKTPHSERLIPLLGVSLEAAKILDTQGGWGKRLGKNTYATTVITKHFRDNNTFEHKRQTFYSLRHWYQDQLTKLGVVDRIQCQLMGHKFNRPTYGDGAPLDMLRDTIAKFAL